MKNALLLIDPYNDFLAEEGKIWPHVAAVAQRLGTLDNLRRLVAHARASAIPILYVPHRQWTAGDYEGWNYLTPTQAGVQRLKPFVRGSWGAEFHPDFAVQPGDVVAHEHWLHSGFANTDLDLQLRARGVDRVLIAGMRGNACVEGTARWAAELGYHVTLVKDATATIRWEEWVATFEVNAPGYAHAIVTTEEVVAGREVLAG